MSFKKVNYLEHINKSEDAIVKLRGVDLWFGKVGQGIHAIKGMNLNLEKNEILGLVGESGSGKSTTGNAIIGLVDRQEGDIVINNEFNVPKKTAEIKKKANEYLVNNVQMILQDPTSSLNPYKNIYKVVTEGLRNVDVRKNFLKTFDGRTIVGLKDIAENTKQKQPECIQRLTVEQLNTLVENNEVHKLRNELYVGPLQELENSTRLIDKKIYTLLKFRYQERKKFIVHGEVKKKKAIKKIATDIVESIGLSRNTFERFPLEFSGGQQQRIGIARAVALRPKVLIADEPISALDVSIQAQVINIIKELREDFNLSILFIAHDLMMVEYVSDRIAVMYRGQLVEIAKSEQIMKNPMHPYTKSLIASVPSIDNVTMIEAVRYNPAMHGYNEKHKPEWHESTKEEGHFVYASTKELKKWSGGK